MIRAFLMLPLLLAAILASVPGAQAQRMPRVQEVVSPGGITAWLVENHTNPVLSLDFQFVGGIRQVPVDKAGLARLTMGLLDEGAGDMDSLAFRSRLENHAIRLSFGAGREQVAGSLRTLTQHRDLAAEMLRRALTQPRFDPDPVDRVRSQLVTSLKRERKDPSSIAFHQLFARLYGDADSPYARRRSGRVETLAGLTPADMRRFVAENLTRDRLIVSAAGDITPEALGRLLDEVFGALPAEGAPIPQATPMVTADGGVTVVERPVPQSVAAFAQPGLTRDDPDWWPARVALHILGGSGLTSRLMTEVRDKRGLAYGIGASLTTYEDFGLILGRVATRNDRVAESLEVLRDQWRRMAEEGPTPEELERALTYITGSFPLRLDSTAGVAGILTQLQREKLGLDYLDRRTALIEAVTLADVKRVAAELLAADRLTTVVVGQPEGL